jgi:GABA(A) receptor-associated protein
MTKYPERIPVICEKKTGGNTPDIDKNKYLVPNDLTIGQFLFVLRKHIKLMSTEALYLFVNGSIPPTSELIQNVYARNKDPDGFVYFVYACENTFG